ncbi:MAG: Arc family DNA-binding protein [Ardenticatenaceae bacterium]|nr:Arc family DNA-binding protein [Ardenticatenaceae bacterium]
MATLTIKNMPDELYEKLRASAAANRRSINNEVIFMLEQLLAGHINNFDTALTEIRQLREKLNIYVTEEELNRAKNEGRP